MHHINVFIHVVIPIFPKKFCSAKHMEQLLVHFLELCCHTGLNLTWMRFSPRGFWYPGIEMRNDKLGLL